MKISANMLGGIILVVALLTTFHWIYAHILKGTLVPELAVAITILFILGGLIATGKLKIK